MLLFQLFILFKKHFNNVLLNVLVDQFYYFFYF